MATSPVKRLVILGSSGSIGRNAIRLVRGNPLFQVVGLAVNSNTRSLVEDAQALGVRHVAVADRAAAAALRPNLPDGMVLHEGDEGVVELAGLEADVLLCAIVGMAGLRPVLKAIETGKDIALATKEVLVAAGEVVMRERARHGVRILPVDSEHSAIFQCLQSAAYTPACVAREGDPAAEKRIRRLILTASGGPFGLRPEVDLAKVTLADALKHPTWSMGRKITIDSATMMNKGLEIIEARWLFDVPASRIDAVIHPESIIHSLVEFVDKTQLAELSVPDMTFAINYALVWPERVACPHFQGEEKVLDLAILSGLHFHAPDYERFRALKLARQAIDAGGTYPAVLNGANEVAAAAFLDGRISFPAIWETVEAALEAHEDLPATDLEAVFEADRQARAYAAQRVAR